MTDKFSNPYKGIVKSGDFAKISTAVSREDKDFLRRVSPRQGVETAIVNTLYFRFVRELERRGITEFTQWKELESFAANFVIALPGELKRVK